jgi:hypothetical protein
VNGRTLGYIPGAGRRPAVRTVIVGPTGPSNRLLCLALGGDTDDPAGPVADAFLSAWGVEPDLPVDLSDLDPGLRALTEVA